MFKGQPLLKNILIFFIIACLSTGAFGADIEIKTSVDRTKVGLNQNFKITVDVSGAKADNAGNPQMPDISTFAAYMGSSGTSSNIQIINGRMSVSKSHSFTYRAISMGKFTIPGASIKFGGKEYRSKPIHIEVVKAAAQQPRTQQRRTQTPATQSSSQVDKNSLYLKVTASKRQVYVNEPVILNYKIYTRVSVTQYGIIKLPNTAGFWAEEYDIGKQPQTHEEIINGQKFIVAEIKRMALFPTDAGKKTIGAMEIECNVRVQQRRRSVFDSFFDDPFFGRSVRKLVHSNPVTINVLPLPAENKPSNYSGLVGSFNVNANVDKKQVKTNEAISLKINISGTGNIKMIPNPKVELPTDFEQYSPKVSEKISRNDRGITGSKTFEYVLVARYPGEQKIKPIEFSYFDVRTKKYKTLRTKAILVNVEKSGDQFVTVTSGHSKEDVKYLGQDIRFIQQGIPDFKKIGSQFYKSFYFLIILLLPLIAVGVSYGYRRHLDKISGNVAYARSRKANQMAMKRLSKAKKFLSPNTQKQYYAEVAKSLLGFLGDKLNIPSAGIITDEVEDLMKNKNVKEDVIKQYLLCLKMCDYQRFAPSDAQLEEMEIFFDEAKQAIVSLEKVI
ncbi:protein BatD [candidate division KSB1 bacterium]|nr:protein BatD [candidate division KSB1 bacterium]MBL7092361.1 protein BatD [candidate division KSB1 bacterium]